MGMVSAIDNYHRGLEFLKQVQIQYDDAVPFGFSSKTTVENDYGYLETYYVVPYVNFSFSLNGTAYPELYFQRWRHCEIYVSKLRHMETFSMESVHGY
jgi:hypothetical protein